MIWLTRNLNWKWCSTLAVTLALSGQLSGLALAQSTQKETATAKPVSAEVPARKTSPYHPERIMKSSKGYYQAVWGIDNLLVRQTASGNLIRFSYRVVDSKRAMALGDSKATPYMYGQRSRAMLQVPVMNKVGQLRQTTGNAESGQDYWMVFSNKGNFVKVGDRVDVIIGSFRAVGLMVE
ncbi:MAG TPA: hypothetical protein VFF82_05930 [Rhodocyclaceae bacterium]|nr:hypothetical protein [Rhodocyclaceae bacterium]